VYFRRLEAREIHVLRLCDLSVQLSSFHDLRVDQVSSNFRINVNYKHSWCLIYNINAGIVM